MNSSSAVEIEFEKLKARLLDLGGTSVAEPEAKCFDSLLEFGEVFETAGRQKMQGKQTGSHKLNACVEYASQQREANAFEIVEGWALFEGVWKQHTWTWDGERVYDMDEQAVLYFGETLCDECAVWFVMGHLIAKLPGYEEAVCDEDDEEETETVKQVGEITVDAGICWVGDPCYILHQESAPKAIGSNWEKLGEILFAEGHTTYKQFCHDNGHAGLGVVVQTGYGDGIYPVFAKFNEDGRIARVWVDFINVAA